MFHSRVMFEDSQYIDKFFQTCEEDRPLVVQVLFFLILLRIVMWK